jgi:hypothetical protein
VHHGAYVIVLLKGVAELMSYKQINAIRRPATPAPTT